MIKRFVEHINEAKENFKYIDYIQALLDKYNYVERS